MNKVNSIVSISMVSIFFLNLVIRDNSNILLDIQKGLLFQEHTHVKEYNSGNNSELVNSVQISTVKNWSQGDVVYAIQLSQLKKCDLIDCLVDMEVTNDVLPDQTISVVSKIILSDHPAKLPGDPNTFEISREEIYDVSPDMHHGHIVISKRYKCAFDFNKAMYVNFCMMAQSNMAGVNQFITVNQDYGRLSLLVFSK